MPPSPLPVQFIISGCLSIGAEKSPTECAVSVCLSPYPNPLPPPPPSPHTCSRRWGAARARVKPAGAKLCPRLKLVLRLFLSTSNGKRGINEAGCSPFAVSSRAEGALGYLRQGWCWGGPELLPTAVGQKGWEKPLHACR